MTGVGGGVIPVEAELSWALNPKSEFPNSKLRAAQAGHSASHT
jgi:hypothetical protein